MSPNSSVSKLIAPDANMVGDLIYDDSFNLSKNPLHSDQRVDIVIGHTLQLAVNSYPESCVYNHVASLPGRIG